MTVQNVVVLSADGKAVAVKAAGDLRHAVTYLSELINQGQLTEEMRNTVCGLLDHYVADLCEPLGYNAEAQKRLDEQYAEIRKLNGKIHELERQLGEAAPIDTVPKLLQSLHDEVRDWWGNEGMGWIHEFDYGPYGTVHAKFSFSFDHVYTGSKTPVSDKETRKNNIALLEKKGFIFVTDESEPRLLDCDKNRKLLVMLLTVRFPSIEIQYWENRSVYKSEKFALWGIKATIRDIHDL